jgi:hypothetical protein
MRDPCATIGSDGNSRAQCLGVWSQCGVEADETDVPEDLELGIIITVLFSCIMPP